MSNGGRFRNNNGYVTGCKPISTTSAVSFSAHCDQCLSSPESGAAARSNASLRRERSIVRECDEQAQARIDNQCVVTPLDASQGCGLMAL